MRFWYWFVVVVAFKSYILCVVAVACCGLGGDCEAGQFTVRMCSVYAFPPS